MSENVLKINDVYHGFKVIQKKYIEEIKTECYELLHEKSGARLAYLDNSDENKVFSISFRTTPKDDTGVAHIVEHSVLCGSRKFPSKEPFVELVKGSLNTFLNAMTFPDKTMYPIASMNDKDFRNLMDVYLDAVFYPNMVKDNKVLQQEGWHYEITTPEEPLTYSGVVYNEMKGALASPESILERRSMNYLYPDTTYQYESGGDPEAIPNLTQEGFLDFHGKYYHPSNSYIFLYGKMDILYTLAFINDEYLSHFDKIEVNSGITKQPAFKQRHYHEDKYPIAPGESTENKTYLSLNFNIGDSLDHETSLSFDILGNALLDAEGAPLRQALIEANLAEDVNSSYESGIYQPYFSINLIGSEADRREQFEEVVDSTLRRIVADGIDKDLLQAAINTIEFGLREGDTGSTPKGLLMNISMMSSWLYDGDPFTYLSFEDIIAKLKQWVDTDYYEKLIEKYLLSNSHSHLLTLAPDENIIPEKEKALQDKLAKIKAGLSEAEILAIIEDTKALKAKQQSIDSPEVLATIPLLKLEDIDKKAKEYKLETEVSGGVENNFYTADTNGIAYLSLLFDINSVMDEDYMYLLLLNEIMGKVDTKNYSYAELDNAIRINSGGLTTKVLTFNDNNDSMDYKPYFVIKAKALYAQVPTVLKLIEEMLLFGKYDNGQRLKQLLLELKVDLETSILRSSHVVAKSELYSYLTPANYLRNKGSLPFYNFVKELLKDFDAALPQIQAAFQRILPKISTKQALQTLVTSEASARDNVKKQLADFSRGLSDLSFPKQQLAFREDIKNEGLITSTTVQYVFKGADFAKLGYKYNGSMRVLDTILRYEYLWTNIRVMGGAYGSFVDFGKDGLMSFGSYRDPNLEKTLEVYDNTASYIENIDLTPREMTKYIIGTISKLDTPISKENAGLVAFVRKINHVDQADIQRERDEVLATTSKELQNLAPVIKACMDLNAICVVGSDTAVNRASKEFKTIKTII